MDKKKALNIASFGYIVVALIGIVTMIVYLNKPSLAANLIKQAKDLKMSINAIIISTYVISTIITLLFFWATRRVAKGKSRGTILLVLLILGAVGNIFAIVKNFSVYTLVYAVFEVILIALIFAVRADEDND
jgi:uncharacterized BrkB/YihY/UPF0761 family membrane protein